MDSIAHRALQPKGTKDAYKLGETLDPPFLIVTILKRVRWNEGDEVQVSLTGRDLLRLSKGG